MLDFVVPSWTEQIFHVDFLGKGNSQIHIFGRCACLGPVGSAASLLTCARPVQSQRSSYTGGQPKLIRPVSFVLHLTYNQSRLLGQHASTTHLAPPAFRYTWPQCKAARGRSRLRQWQGLRSDGELSGLVRSAPGGWNREPRNSSDAQ